MLRHLLVVLLAAGALVAAACGSDDDSLAALDLAAEKTRDVESMRTEMSLDADFQGESMSMEAEGTSNADSTRGRMTLSMESGADSFDADAILLDDTIFIKYKRGVRLPDGKQWLRMQDEELGVRTLTPGEFVRFLRESDEIEVVGTEDVRGAETTHYRGPLDMKDLVERTGDEAVDMFKEIPGAESADAVIDIWVGEDGLPARMALDMRIAGGTMKMHADVLEYDVPLEAEPPPEEQVAELSDLQ